MDTKNGTTLPSPAPRKPEHLIDAHEVAAMLSVDISWVKNHCTRVAPYLPYVQLGLGKNAKRRFKPSEIAAFIDENTRRNKKRA